MSNVRKMVLISDTLLSLYRRMALLRCCEEQFAELVRQGRLSSACRPRYGLEAMGAGLAWHLRDEDLLFGPDYARGLALAKNVEPKTLFRKWLGESGPGGEDPSPLDGNSYRMRFDASGFIGAGVLAKPSLRHAVGAALGFRMRGSEHVAAILFSANLVGSGEFHESLQLAKSQSLPLVYLCDHPLTPDAPPAHRLALRMRAYGLPCVFIDGGDLSAVYAAANEAVARARQEGPTFIECATHCFEPRRYATASQEQTALAAWVGLDPLSRMHDLLIEQHQVRASELNAILADVHQSVRASIKKFSPSS